MTRMLAAWIGWYTSNGDAFDAMADRLAADGDLMESALARGESWKQYAAAARLRELDSIPTTV